MERIREISPTAAQRLDQAFGGISYTHILDWRRDVQESEYFQGPLAAVLSDSALIVNIVNEVISIHPVHRFTVVDVTKILAG